MNLALQHFEANVARVRELGGLYRALQSLTTSAIDKSDILRSQLVLGVSALDCYVHEVTCYGMLAILDGNRPATPTFNKFRVSIDVLTNSSSFRNAFEIEVRERHSFLSFQHPDKIADAIRLISGIALWEQVAGHLSTTVNDVKGQLRQIVDRRNKIAHEADADPSYPGLRWPITENDVEASVDFLEGLVRAIHLNVS